MTAEAAMPVAAAMRKKPNSTIIGSSPGPKILGPRRRSAYGSVSKLGTTLSLRSEGVVDSTTAKGESSAGEPKLQLCV